MLDYDKIKTKIEEYDRFEKTIWNEALECAAVDLAKSYPDNVSTNAFCAAIRSLKK